MKQRQHKGAIIDPAFEVFGDFLRHMGPLGRSRITHSIVSTTTTRSIAKPVRVADQVEQNANKSTSIFLTDENGTTRPLIEWPRPPVRSPTPCASGGRQTDQHRVHPRQTGAYRTAELVPEGLERGPRKS